MIVEKIDQYLSGSDQTINEEVVNRMWESFKHAITRQLMEPRKKTNSLRGSNPGPCARKMGYGFLGFEPTEPLEPRAKLTFLQGDILELVSVGIMKLAGVNVTDTVLDEEGQSEGFFEVGNGLYIPCHGDGILNAQIGVTDEPRLLEIKSASDFSFKRGYMNNDVGDQYLLQHNIYLETFGLDKGIFFVVNKNTGHYTEVLTEKDPEIVEWGRKNYILAGLATEEELPPRFMDHENYGLKKDRSGEIVNSLCWGCSYCDYTRYCWPGVELSFDRGRPVYTIPESLKEEALGDEWTIRLGHLNTETPEFDLFEDF